MPMRLLLDAHVPAAVGRQLRKQGIDVQLLSDWLGGEFRTAADHSVLEAALRDNRVLLTYDLETIPSLLKAWAESGQAHAGVVLVNQQAIPSDDVGKLVRAITSLVHAERDLAWENRITFLRRG